MRDPARKELLVIGSQTSDVRRVVAALRRRWMVILAAVLVGAVLGLGYITAARPATYTTVVWLPPVGVKNLVGISEDAQPNIKQLVSDLSSASTYQLLGTAVEGAKVALAPDANELSIKVSASSDSLKGQKPQRVLLPLRRAGCTSSAARRWSMRRRKPSAWAWRQQSPRTGRCSSCRSAHLSLSRRRRLP